MARLFYLFSFFVFTFLACQEIAPTLTSGPPFDPPPNQRQVLMEEFSGVECIACPAGSAIIEDLIDLHGDKLIAITIHTGDLADPYPESNHDFRTEEGGNLINYLGQPWGLPSAVVNRKKFDGQTTLQLGKGDWPGYVAEELSKSPMVTIGIEPTFDASSREVDIDVALLMNETVTASDIRLSVVFTEDNIVDAQLTPESSPGVDTDYVHKHILRGMATPYDGIRLSEDLIVGTELTKSFSYSIPVGWNEKEVNVIAFVSLGGEEKDVLQVHKVHLVE